MTNHLTLLGIIGGYGIFCLLAACLQFWRFWERPKKQQPESLPPEAARALERYRAEQAEQELKESENDLHKMLVHVATGKPHADFAKLLDRPLRDR
jgi:hypothetical protein